MRLWRSWFSFEGRPSLVPGDAFSGAVALTTSRLSFGRSPFSNARKTASVHRLLYPLGWPSRVTSPHPCPRPGNTVWKWRGSHVRELRAGPLAEGLPTALHRRMKVNWSFSSGAEDPKRLSYFLRISPRQANPGVSLKQQSVILTSRALQCKAELVMLFHFSPLFTAREPHKLIQKGLPAQPPIIA